MTKETSQFIVWPAVFYIPGQKVSIIIQSESIKRLEHANQIIMYEALKICWFFSFHLALLSVQCILPSKTYTDWRCLSKQ